MDRRRFMAAASTGVVGAAAAGLAAPALAQTMPALRWRCASSFPSVLDTAFGGALDLARLVREASDGGFEIEVLPACTIAPAGDGTTAAVVSGSVEMCHTSTGYSALRNPVYALGAAVPFGLNARGMQAWLNQGEGLALLNRFFHQEGLHYHERSNFRFDASGWRQQGHACNGEANFEVCHVEGHIVPDGLDDHRRRFGRGSLSANGLA